MVFIQCICLKVWCSNNEIWNTVLSCRTLVKSNHSVCVVVGDVDGFSSYGYRRSIPPTQFPIESIYGKGRSALCRIWNPVPNMNPIANHHQITIRTDIACLPSHGIVLSEKSIWVLIRFGGERVPQPIATLIRLVLCIVVPNEEKTLSISGDAAWGSHLLIRRQNDIRRLVR